VFRSTKRTAVGAAAIGGPGVAEADGTGEAAVVGDGCCVGFGVADANRDGEDGLSPPFALHADSARAPTMSHLMGTW
jgi:hypothetical protein